MSFYIFTLKTVVYFITQIVLEPIRSQRKNASNEHTKENRFQAGMEKKKEWPVILL